MMKLSTEDLDKRRAETDRLAMLMCEEFGLDPHTNTTCKLGDDVTPYDHGMAAHPYYDLSPIELGFPGASNVKIAQHKYEQVSVQQWRLFRPHAAKAIAYQRAFERYMLTEA